MVPLPWPTKPPTYFFVIPNLHLKMLVLSLADFPVWPLGM